MTNKLKHFLMLSTSFTLIPTLCNARVTPAHLYKQGAFTGDHKQENQSKEEAMQSCLVLGADWSPDKIENADCIGPSAAPSGENCYKCSCSANFKLWTCPQNGNCTQCGNKYRLDSCNGDYIVNGDKTACTAICTDYPLTSCPSGGVCSDCKDNKAKKKLDKCLDGWSKNGNTCQSISCPTGYSTSVTSCDSASTKPNLRQSGYSEGKKCGMCYCANVNSQCSETNFPLVETPYYATYDVCSTGCGSESVTRYKILACDEGYVLGTNRGLPSCLSAECSDYGYSDTYPDAHECTAVDTPAGRCYTSNCTKKQCSDYGYSSTPPTTGQTCTTKRPLKGLECYTDCRCNDGYVLENGACVQKITTCRDLGLISSPDVYTDACNQQYSACTGDGAYVHKVMINGKEVSCMDPVCSTIFDGAITNKNQCTTTGGTTGGNTGGGGGSTYSGEEAGEDDNQGFCQSNQSMCMINDYLFMAPKSIFAKNSKQPLQKAPVSIAAISDDECLSKYVSFLNQNTDSDDFIIYA